MVVRMELTIPEKALLEDIDRLIDHYRLIGSPVERVILNREQAKLYNKIVARKTEHFGIVPDLNLPTKTYKHNAIVDTSLNKI